MKRLSLLLLLLPSFAYADDCINYSVNSTQYHAAAVSQTPTQMTEWQWAVGSCGVTPPPPDPGAYTTLSVAWYGHQNNGGTRTVDATDWTQFIGRLSSTDATAAPYPGVNGPTFGFNVSNGKYVGARFMIPLGYAGARTLATNGYDGATHNVLVRAAIVPDGQGWPIGPATGCNNVGQIEDQSTLLTFAVGLPANPYRCDLIPGRWYKVLIGYASPTQAGHIVLWWH